MKERETRGAMRLYGISFMVLLLAALGCSTKNNKEANVTEYQDLKKKVSGVLVKTVEGKEVALDSLWKDRRIVLGFTRHFG